MSMRKTGRKLPAYCEHKPTGQAYVRITVDGKRQTLYLGKYNSRESLAEYDRIVGEWVATKSAESKTKSPTIRDIAERYRSHQEPLLSRDKLYNLGNAMKLLTELFGHRPAEEFGVRQMEQLRSELIRREYAREYGNRLIRIVKACCEWAMCHDYLSADQERKIQTIKRLTSAEAPTKIVKGMDDADVDAVLPYLSNHAESNY